MTDGRKSLCQKSARSVQSFRHNTAYRLVTDRRTMERTDRQTQTHNDSTYCAITASRDKNKPTLLQLRNRPTIKFLLKLIASPKLSVLFIADRADLIETRYLISHRHTASRQFYDSSTFCRTTSGLPSLILFKSRSSLFVCHAPDSTGQLVKYRARNLFIGIASSSAIAIG